MTALQPKRFGTPAHQMQQFMDSVASNIGIDRLQAMRESSPTGGALGQVPVQQQLRLEQLLGSLQIDQPPDVLEDNIKRVQNIYLDIIHGTGQGPARKRLSFDEMGRKVPGGAQWRGDPEIQRYESQASTGPAPAPQQQSAEITATGPNGEKIVLRDGQWVPLQ